MEKRFVIPSPSMSTAITVSLSENGGLTYFSAQDGITVIKPSAMGIIPSAGYFTNGLVFVSEDDSIINETYPMLSGKRKIYTNGCVVGQCTVESLGNHFADPARQASSNYGVGKDSRIGIGRVPEIQA